MWVLDTAAYVMWCALCSPMAKLHRWYVAFSPADASFAHYMRCTDQRRGDAGRSVSLREIVGTIGERPCKHVAVCQNLVPLVNIKIAGKWMFIPLKMVLIGIDPYPCINLQLLPFGTLSLPYQITWVLKHRLHPGFGYVAPAWGVAGHSDRTAFMTFMIHIYIYSYDQIGIYDSFIYDNYDHLW